MGHSNSILIGPFVGTMETSRPKDFAILEALVLSVT